MRVSVCLVANGRNDHILSYEQKGTMMFEGIFTNGDMLKLINQS